MFELAVKIKGDDQTLTRKFVVYEENVQLNIDDPILKSSVESTIKDFKGSVDDVILTVKMVW